MVESPLAQALDLVRVERQEVESALERLGARLAVLEQTEAGLKGLLNGQAGGSTSPTSSIQPPTTNGYPRISDAIVRVLQENPGRYMSANEIAHQAKDLGLLNPTLRWPEGSVLEASKRLAGKSDSGVKRHKYKRRLRFRYEGADSLDVEERPDPEI